MEGRCGLGKDGKCANVIFGALVSQLFHRLSVVVAPVSSVVDLPLSFVLMTSKELMEKLERPVALLLALHSRMMVMYNTRSQCLSAALRTCRWRGQTSAQIPRQLACHSLSVLY